MKKGFIFDLDGVIVDTAKYHFLAWQKIAQELGFHLSLEQNEQLKGISRVDSLKKIVKWSGKTISQTEFDTFAQRKNQDYLQLVGTMTKADILPGISDFLHALKAQKMPVALGSASKNAVFILEKVGLITLFDVVVDGNSVSKAKPDPEVFQVAAQKLAMAYDDCVVFEDSEAGISAAKKTQMLAIGIGAPHILHQADKVFTSLQGITPEIIISLFNK